MFFLEAFMQILLEKNHHCKELFIQNIMVLILK